MKLGTVFSHPQMGNDPAAIRDFAQAMEGAGLDHIVAAEHVAGGHPDRLGNERVHTYDVRSTTTLSSSSPSWPA